MTAFEIVTLILGVIGTWLVIMSYWRKTRVKLKVKPAHAITQDASLQFSIDVVNLSAFPVTIDETGVFYSGTKNRGAIVNPVLIDGGGWPRRLEPHESVSVLSQLPISQNGEKIRCAYGRTTSGHVTKGNSAALKQISEETFYNRSAMQK